MPPPAGKDGRDFGHRCPAGGNPPLRSVNGLIAIHVAPEGKADLLSVRGQGRGADKRDRDLPLTQILRSAAWGS